MVRIVRVDGRSFTKLQVMRPCDSRFIEAMHYTAINTMESSGFNITRAYVASDEISFELSSEDNLFNRREDKVISTFAATTTAYFVVKMEVIATFDARILEVDDTALYFEQRKATVYNNALSSILHYNGESPYMPIENKEKYVDTSKYPDEFLYGAFFERRAFLHNGINPLTGETVVVERRRIVKC